MRRALHILTTLIILGVLAGPAHATPGGCEEGDNCGGGMPTTAPAPAPDPEPAPAPAPDPEPAPEPAPAPAPTTAPAAPPPPPVQQPPASAPRPAQPAQPARQAPAPQPEVQVRMVANSAQVTWECDGIHIMATGTTGVVAHLTDSVTGPVALTIAEPGDLPFIQAVPATTVEVRAVEISYATGDPVTVENLPAPVDCDQCLPTHDGDLIENADVDPEVSDDPETAIVADSDPFDFGPWADALPDDTRATNGLTATATGGTDMVDILLAVLAAVGLFGVVRIVVSKGKRLFSRLPRLAIVRPTK